MGSVSGVGVLDKSVTILATIAEGGPYTLAELVERTRLPRATAHRLVSALEDHDLVGRDERGRYRLGLRVLAWGARAATGLPLADAAAPVLAALRDATDESAQLYVRDGDRRVCVAAAERPSGLRDTVPVGAALPLTAGSAAKVILAWAPDADRFPQISAAERALVRRQGWASSVGERESGVASVSAPVFDPNAQTVVGVVSVSGPVDRLGRRPGARFAPEVVAAARDLERRAGLGR